MSRYQRYWVCCILGLLRDQTSVRDVDQHRISSRNGLRRMERIYQAAIWISCRICCANQKDIRKISRSHVQEELQGENDVANIEVR